MRDERFCQHRLMLWPSHSVGQRLTRSLSRILLAALVGGLSIGWSQPSARAQGLPKAAMAAEGDAGGGTAAEAKGVAIDKANWKQKNAAKLAYRAGMRSFRAKKYDEALAKFRESYATVASPNSHLMVVQVLSAMGKSVEAYEEAKIVAAEAEAVAAKIVKYKKAAKAAQSTLEELKGKVSFVTVKVAGEAGETAILSVNGQEIDRAAWGQVMVLVPGEVQVKLATDDGNSIRKVEAAAGEEVEVSIAPPAPKPPPTVEVAVDPGFKWPGPDRKMLAFIGGGVGAAGFLTMGVFGALSNGQLTRLEDACPEPNYCNPDYEAVADRGRTYQALANTGLVLGLIGVSAGAGFFVWDYMDGGADSAQHHVRPKVSLGPGSMTVSGRF